MGDLVVFVTCLCLAVIQGVQAQHGIAGGEPTTIELHPYVTSLLTNSGSGSYVQGCTGVIIYRDAILSAAGCFHDGDTVHPASWWRARVGSNYSNSGGTTYLVRLITPHPEYSSTTRQHDLAVLKTTFNFDYSTKVGPAALVGAAHSMSTHDAVYAVGFAGDESSTDQELREVRFWVVDRELCTGRYGNIGFEVTENMECAGWLDVGVRAQCSGDEGGPLMQSGALVGVFSWTQACAGDGWFTGINTRVAAYTSWIVNTAVSTA